MRDQTKYGDIVKTYTGQGEITFPLGGRIQSNFELTEYSTGKRLLTCSGRFKKASYAGWERLVSHYQVDAHRPATQKTWPAERYEGQTAENHQLTIRQMFLIDARATAVAADNLTLQMEFDCQDASLQPASVAEAVTALA